MLWWAVGGLFFVYALVLTFLYFRRRNVCRVVVILKLAPECPAAELEWILYSFRRFLDKEFPDAFWWVVSGKAGQQVVLFRLAGRFAYRLAECYNQEKEHGLCYFFTACSAASAMNWRQELHSQGGRKAGRQKSWRGRTKN